MNIKTKVNLNGLEKMVSPAEHERRQIEYAMRACFVMTRYVPMEEGTLRGSANINSQFEKGLLVWNTPYAAKQYYVPMTHSTSGTCDHWDEACARNDMAGLIAYAKTLYGGY